MFFTSKAYLNSGGQQILNLTHDVKRCLLDSTAVSGHINIVSPRATVGIALMENDAAVQKALLDSIINQFSGDEGEEKVARRSGAGAGLYHLMAGMCGLSLTVPFDSGKLISSPFHEIVALDFEKESGRREFILSVVGEGAPAKQQ